MSLEFPRGIHQLRIANLHDHAPRALGQRSALICIGLLLAMTGAAETSIAAPRVIGSSIQDKDTVSISNLTLHAVLQFDKELAAISDPSSIFMVGSTGTSSMP